MKKNLLSLGVAVLLAATASAQISYGVKVGVNTGKITNLGKDIYEGVLEDYESTLTSVFITGYADVPIVTNFSVQPGVSLQGKGAKFAGSGGNFDGSLVRNLLFVEIPVNAVYSIPTGSVGSAFVGAGPYAAYAISARDEASKTYTRFLDRQASAKLKRSGEEKAVNAFDAGLNFLAGFKTAGGFLINANYGWGLLNLNPGTRVVEDPDAEEPNFIIEKGSPWNTRVLSFGIGLQF